MHSPEVLRQLFSYNPDTGELVRKPRPREMFKSDRAYNAWAARFLGANKLHVNQKGYLRVKIDNYLYSAHRVAWAIFYGRWPKVVDHIDGNQKNNTISNLRECSMTQNGWNRGKNKNNNSGFKGVSYHKMTGKWQAVITIPNEKQKYLGLYKTPEEAHAAYREAASELHGEFANYG